MAKSIPDIPFIAQASINIWRGLTFLWAILALSGTWWQPKSSSSYSLWSESTPKTSDRDAARAFTLMTFMFSAAQVIAIALSSFKIIGTSDWLQLVLDFCIWLCAVIAFAVFDGSGWGRDMQKATFSFALIMWVFGIVFIFPGFFREQFVRFVDNIYCGQVGGGTKEKTKADRSDDVSDDNLDADGVDGPAPYVLESASREAPSGEAPAASAATVTPKVESAKNVDGDVESVDF